MAINAASSRVMNMWIFCLNVLKFDVISFRCFGLHSNGRTRIVPMQALIMNAVA